VDEQKAAQVGVWPDGVASYTSAIVRREVPGFG